VLARLRVPVAAVKSWTEPVRCRQDVSVGGDLIPDSASMAVTGVVDVRCVLAEKLARLTPPNPAPDNLARECRRIRSRFPAQNVERALARIFALQRGAEASLQGIRLRQAGSEILHAARPPNPGAEVQRAVAEHRSADVSALFLRTLRRDAALPNPRRK